MKYGLNIRQGWRLGFHVHGRLFSRLDPGIIPFRKATECQIHVSGGEFNVAANLADCFRLKTGIARAMVDYPIGDLIAERVRAMGVKPFYKHFKHNGVTGPNMATVYSDRGMGVRAPVVFYNRANEAAGYAQARRFRLESDLRRWRSLVSQRWNFRGACRKPPAEVVIEAMKAAKAAGAITSFDLNYRAKLWNISGGHEKAVAVIDRIVENVDVLVGNEEDLQMGLGIPGPEVAAKSKLDPSAFFGMMDNVRKKHPQVKIVATTLREVHSSNRHSWSAVAWINGKTYLAPTVELDVYRSRRRRRWLCCRVLLWFAHRRAGRRSRSTGLGSWRFADDLPGRHDHGYLGSSQIARPGRFGPHPALTQISHESFSKSGRRRRLICRRPDAIIDSERHNHANAPGIPSVVSNLSAPTGCPGSERFRWHSHAAENRSSSADTRHQQAPPISRFTCRPHVGVDQRDGYRSAKPFCDWLG